MAIEPDSTTSARRARRKRPTKRGGRKITGAKKTSAAGEAKESPADREAGTASVGTPGTPLPGKGARKKKAARRRKKKAASGAATTSPGAPADAGRPAAAVEDLVTVAAPIQGLPAEPVARESAEAPAGGRKKGARPGSRRKPARRSKAKAKTPDEPPKTGPVGAESAPPTKAASVKASAAASGAVEPPEREARPRRRRKRRSRQPERDAAKPEPTAVAEMATAVAPDDDDRFGVGLFEPEELATLAEPRRGEPDRTGPTEPPLAAAAAAAKDREDKPAVPARPRGPHRAEVTGPTAAPEPRRRRGGRGRAKAAPEAPKTDRAAATAGKRGQPGKATPSGTDSTDLEMIINVSAGDECRIAVLAGGRLEELFIERQSAESHVGSIYKGKVTNVEPSIQAVFVDFGLAKNGFLHISDVHPQYFSDRKATSEDVGRKIPRRERPPIQKCFRRGQEVVVQVTKEGIGTKGPTLTTYLSIPGRFLVMMPGMSRLGVSRKIEDETARRSMRELLGQLELPGGMGFILRSAGLDRTKRELQRDLNYLSRLWKIISQRIGNARPPAEVYQESDLVIRTIRDVLTTDFKRIVVDHEPTADKAREFLKIALPRSQDMVELHDGPQPVFHHYGIEEEIERINARHVPLPSGGSIVIEPTEAMVAIDVNSGTFRAVHDAEESAFQINQQAAEEIARQLRLRDLGGLIVCDFIDMRLEKHKRAVERSLRNALKKHKERARLLRMSDFGLIEITRQRQRTSIHRSIYTECPHCRGSGMVKSVESMALEVMRVLQLVTHQKNVRKVSMTVSPEVASLVQNQRRAQLHELEVGTDTSIAVRGEPQYALDQLACECEDARGRSVAPSM